MSSHNIFSLHLIYEVWGPKYPLIKVQNALTTQYSPTCLLFFSIFQKSSQPLENIRESYVFGVIENQIILSIDARSEDMIFITLFFLELNQRGANEC